MKIIKNTSVHRFDFINKLISNKIFEEVEFRGAFIEGGIVNNCIFKNLGMQTIYIKDNYFVSTTIESCGLSAASFVDSHIINCSFINLIMDGVRFENTSLISCDLENAFNIETDTLKVVNSYYDETTKWPKGFNPLEHGFKLLSSHEDFGE